MVHGLWRSRRRVSVGCLVACVATVFATAGTGWARTDVSGPSWCGTRPGLAEDKVALHRYIERLRGPQPAARALGSEDRNEIAVIEDDGTILLAPNPLDLAGSALVFRPNAQGGYDLATAANGVAGGGAALDLGDDDSALVAIPFAFPIGGTTYRSVFVNSDGNLTFGEKDDSSSTRGLGRFLGPAPRIGPLFADLDPSSAGAVRVTASDESFRVSWNGVPAFGASQGNSFEVELRPEGTIEFRFGDLAVRDAIVGVSPGGQATGLGVDLSAGSGSSSDGTALVEVFRADSTYDDISVAKAFYRTHPDEFDFLAVFWDLDISLGGAFAYEMNIRNDVRGIGLSSFDISSILGSAGRLESYLNMGSLSNYPSVPSQEFLGTNSTLDVLGQEAGHRWLAYLNFDSGSGRSGEILGRDASHWSFCLDSDASDMEGNDWRDDGDGSFTSVGATSGFSLLDQYVMGLLPADQVPPFFYVDACPTQADKSQAPDVGATLSGDKVTLTLADIQRVEGPRVPDASKAPKVFRMAFILITEQGATPSTGTLRHIDTIRRAWNDYFAEATGGRGQMITTLDGGPEDTDPFPPDDGGGSGGGCTGAAGGGRSGLELAVLVLALGILALARPRRSSV